MSNCKMRLMVFCVGYVTLACSASAQAQFFEGCGEIKPTPPPEVCLAFFPDSVEYPGGILGDWGSFQEGDRVFVTGNVEVPKCGSFCTVQGCFLDGNTVAVCPNIPTVSQWGLIVLTLSILVGGTIVIRDGSRAGDFTAV